MASNEPDQLPYLECKNKSGDSHHTIWLPRSSQLRRFPDRPEMSSNTYFEICACPICGHVYEYKSVDVHWRPLQTAGRDHTKELHVAALEFDCGVENCGTRVVIQKPTAEVLTSDQIVKESDAWVLERVRCGKGHPVQGLPSNRRGRMILASGAHLALD